MKSVDLSSFVGFFSDERRWLFMSCLAWCDLLKLAQRRELGTASPAIPHRPIYFSDLQSRPRCGPRDGRLVLRFLRFGGVVALGMDLVHRHLFELAILLRLRVHAMADTDMESDSRLVHSGVHLPLLVHRHGRKSKRAAQRATNRYLTRGALLNIMILIRRLL